MVPNDWNFARLFPNAINWDIQYGFSAGMSLTARDDAGRASRATREAARALFADNILIVDESSMISTAQMRALTPHRLRLQSESREGRRLDSPAAHSVAIGREVGECSEGMPSEATRAPARYGAEQEP